jgi:hypothetical protein
MSDHGYSFTYFSVVPRYQSSKSMKVEVTYAILVHVDNENAFMATFLVNYVENFDHYINFELLCCETPPLNNTYCRCEPLSDQTRSLASAYQESFEYTSTHTLRTSRTSRTILVNQEQPTCACSCRSVVQFLRILLNT